MKKNASQKTPTDLAIELLAALQASERPWKAELRNAWQLVDDLRAAHAEVFSNNKRLQAANDKLRKKLARVTGAASAAHLRLQSRERMKAAIVNLAECAQRVHAQAVFTDGVWVFGEDTFIDLDSTNDALHLLRIKTPPEDHPVADNVRNPWRADLVMDKLSAEKERAAEKDMLCGYDVTGTPLAHGGIEVHGSIGGVDPTVAMACATGEARWPSAHIAILNTMQPPVDPGTWAGMGRYGVDCRPDHMPPGFTKAPMDLSFAEPVVVADGKVTRVRDLE